MARGDIVDVRDKDVITFEYVEPSGRVLAFRGKVSWRRGAYFTLVEKTGRESYWDKNDLRRCDVTEIDYGPG